MAEAYLSDQLQEVAAAARWYASRAIMPVQEIAQEPVR